MSARDHNYDVLIVGAGPAGMAAAWAASQAVVRVGVVDENRAPGGQIWRGETSGEWFKRFKQSRAEMLHGVAVAGLLREGVLLAERNAAPLELGYGKLILCTGARERFLPFPGWTLPNVCGAGGLQALAKGGFPLQGKRVVVAGSGPLLVAVAGHLKKEGAIIVCIAEQTSRRRLLPFAARLLQSPAKLAQAVALRSQLLGVPYRTESWPVRAEGNGKLERVTLCVRGKQRTFACDYLACGYGLVPNIELAALAGCRVDGGAVLADHWQQTTQPGIYAAGEITGVGGAELAVLEGQIAGFSAVGLRDRARVLFGRRERANRFKRALDRAFAIRGDLAQRVDPSTLLCRCEDVTFGRVAEFRTWREAKLQTRCGMGPCQGRVCGPAAEFLLGWDVGDARPPVLGATVRTLSGAS